jgi:hypothetical protein
MVLGDQFWIVDFFGRWEARLLPPSVGIADDGTVSRES